MKNLIVLFAVLAAFLPGLASAQYGGGGGNYSPAPTISPVVGSEIANFVINGGAKTVASTIVTLSMPSTNADQMAISNYEDFRAASWEKYSSLREWILLPEAGLKNVFVMFRDSRTGKTTKVLVNTIDLLVSNTVPGGNAAVVSLPATASPTAVLATDNTGAPSFVFKRYVYIGSRSEEVKQLQQKLRELGYFTYPTNTGYFGSITKAAVVAFQKAYDLKPFPGWIGPATRKILNSL